MKRTPRVSVELEDRNLAGKALETIDGIYTDPDDGSLAAWFVDSEGNTLGMVEDHDDPIRPH